MHDFTGSTAEPVKETMREIVDMGEKIRKKEVKGFKIWILQKFKRY